jgi:hypothetical protein
MRLVKIVISGLILATLVGCAASGPLYTEVVSSIPAVPADKGRIIFFRPDTIFGAAVTANIDLNGKVVGLSERGSFFFVDEVPGNMTVSTATETEKKLTFVLAPKETKYVKTSVSMGVMVGRIIPELVGTEQGKLEIQELHYTGPALK